MQVKIHKKGFAAAALLLASMACGQAEATVFAYVSETIPANSDVLVSVPVNNSIEVELTTTSVAGSAISLPAASIVNGAYNAGGNFAKYYVRFIDGPAAGLWSSISANSASSITIDDAAVAALASAGGGDTIRVYEHHTVNSVFPNSLLDTSFVTGSQLLFFSDSDTQNKAPGSGLTVGYTTFLNIGWGADGARPIYPEEAFIIRNNSDNPLTYVKTGVAPDHAVSFLAKAGVAKDTPRGTGYPVPVTVEETGLGGFTGRQILTQGTGGQNQAPGSAATYGFTTFLNIGWGGDSAVDLAPNSAYLFRQPASDVGGLLTVTKPY